MIEVEYYQGIAARDAARIAADHRLYIDGWYLIIALSMIQSGHRPAAQIALVYDDDRPVAVVVDEGLDQIMAYTKPSHRRRGLASMGVAKMQIDPEKTYADAGIEGSDRFWDAVSVSLRSRRATAVVEA